MPSTHKNDLSSLLQCSKELLHFRKRCFFQIIPRYKVYSSSHSSYHNLVLGRRSSSSQLRNAPIILMRISVFLQNFFSISFLPAPPQHLHLTTLQEQWQGKSLEQRQELLLLTQYSFEKYRNLNLYCHICFMFSCTICIFVNIGQCKLSPIFKHLFQCFCLVDYLTKQFFLTFFIFAIFLGTPENYVSQHMTNYKIHL